MCCSCCHGRSEHTENFKSMAPGGKPPRPRVSEAPTPPRMESGLPDVWNKFLKKIFDQNEKTSNSSKKIKYLIKSIDFCPNLTNISISSEVQEMSDPRSRDDFGHTESDDFFGGTLDRDDAVEKVWKFDDKSSLILQRSL